MNPWVKRVTQDGDQICFNHAVSAAVNGVVVIEILSSFVFKQCKWCNDGIPLNDMPRWKFKAQISEKEE